MIKNIVFDLDNVMLDMHSEPLLRRMGAPEEHVPLLADAVFGGAEWAALCRGDLDMEDALQLMYLRLPSRLWSWAGVALSDWWKYPLSAVPGMGELAEELKAAGLGIYMLADADRSLRKYFFRIPGARAFDGVFVSADWKLSKPEPEIYELFLERFGLTAAECLLIDDKSENVDGALYAGMSALLFDGDAGSLRSALIAAGVLTPREEP